MAIVSQQNDQGETTTQAKGGQLPPVRGGAFEQFAPVSESKMQSEDENDEQVGEPADRRPTQSQAGQEKKPGMRAWPL